MKGGTAKAYAIAFVGALVLAGAIGHFVGQAHPVTAMTGLKVGFYLWLGATVTTSLPSLIFEKRPAGLFYLNIGYYLVQYLVIGLILAVWR